MSEPILASNVTVKTCTVDVKVVRLDKRQMTLSVFRQLPWLTCYTLSYYPILDKDGEPVTDEDGCPIEEAYEVVPCGTIWGRVNYCGAHCGNSSAHIHVIWQGGDDRLYQGTVFTSYREECRRSSILQSPSSRLIDEREWGNFIGYLLDHDQLFIAT